MSRGHDCRSVQNPEFNAWFYSTVQLVLAGNDSQGLKYGTIGTPDTYFLAWKEDEADGSRFKLDKYLLKLTGTPLLKKDKATSLEVFGGYIHTYKFSEAVADEVALDLIYEARDINQRLGSKEKIDAWFEIKIKGLSNWQKEELKGR